MDEIKKENTVEQEKDNTLSMTEEIQNWVESHASELITGALSFMLLITAGRCIDLNRKNKTLVCYAICLKNKVGDLLTTNHELRRELYSLAGDATRCGSSIGGQVLYAARNNKPSVIS